MFSLSCVFFKWLVQTKLIQREEIGDGLSKQDQNMWYDK